MLAWRKTIGLGAVLAVGCVFVDEDSDYETTSATPGDVDDGTTGGGTTTSTSVTTDGGTSSPDVPSNCENVLGDSGFEAGTPNPWWAEASLLYGTPICDSSCSPEAGAEPASGDWWVWFGGEELVESASVSQSFVVPAGVQATLKLSAAINGIEGPRSDDVMLVEIDDDILLRLSYEDMNNDSSYRPYTIDVGAYADGALHRLTISAELGGVGLTNFFVDDVQLTACEISPSDSGDGTGTTTSGGETSEATGTSESSSGETSETGSESTTGSETAGESSSG